MCAFMSPHPKGRVPYLCQGKGYILFLVGQHDTLSCEPVVRFLLNFPRYVIAT